MPDRPKPIWWLTMKRTPAENVVAVVEMLRGSSQGSAIDFIGEAEGKQLRPSMAGRTDYGSAAAPTSDSIHGC
jgi:hypothetical protein